MGALASLATVVGAGATVLGNVRQAQAQAGYNRAQAQQQANVAAARSQELAVQQAEQARLRQLSLNRTVAGARARLAAGGVLPDDGSAAALTAGLVGDAAAAQAADNAAFQDRLAQGRSSLLAQDGTVTAALRSGRSFGTITDNLLA